MPSRWSGLKEAIAVLLVGEDMLTTRGRGSRTLAALARAMLLGHFGLPLGLGRRWMRLFEHVGLHAGNASFLAAAIGAVGPDIASGVACVDYPPQLPTVAVGRAAEVTAAFADKAEAPIDADMRLIAEHRCGDLRQAGCRRGDSGSCRRSSPVQP